MMCCGNPSGKVKVTYADNNPRVRYLYCWDCGDPKGVELLDEQEPVPTHPDNCICCAASKN